MKTFKTLALAAALTLTAAAPAFAVPETSAAATEAKSEFVTAYVNGLVCDFCAQSIQKVFRRKPPSKACMSISTAAKCIFR